MSDFPTIEIPVAMRKRETFWFDVTPKILDEYKCKSAEELKDKIVSGDFAPLGFIGNWDTDDVEITNVFTDKIRIGQPTGGAISNSTNFPKRVD